MTTATATLAEFLLARMAEDEAVARDAGIATGDRGFGDERLASGQEWGTSYHEVVRRRVLPDQEKRVIADAGGFGGLSIAPHIALHDPARVLAECEAKRRIVELHAEEATDDPPDGGVGCVVCDETNYSDGGRYSSGWPCDTLRALVAVYADHEDFRKEWAP